MSRSGSVAKGEPRRIVVRGVNWLGDAVMTTPALLRLRERFPQSEITLLTPLKLKDLWTDHPALDHVLAFTANEGVWTVARRLRAEGFDLAVVLPNSVRSALEVWLAGIVRRVGGTWPWRDFLLTDVVPPPADLVRMRKRSTDEVRRLVTPAGENSKGKTQNRRFEPPASSHQMFHYLRLAASLGANPAPLAPRLAVSPGEIEAVRAKFGFHPGSQWLGLNPGAEYGPAKRWPLDRFAAAAAAMHAEAGCGIAVFGSLADVGLAETLAAELATAAPTVRILAGKTSLRELLAALTFCRVLLTNDTGPMHAAAALGVPVVVPFGSTSPGLTAPGLPGTPRNELLRVEVPCSPCFLRECPIDFRCLTGIAVPQVVQAIRRAWR